MKKLSKHFKKTLSMVIAVAIIMSVCAVSFSTFGNAYTISEAGHYYYDFVGEDGEKIQYAFQGAKGTGGITKLNDAKNIRYLDPTFYGEPSKVGTKACYQFVNTGINLGSADGKIVFEPGKVYEIALNHSRINVNNCIVSLGAMDKEGNVFPLESQLTFEEMLAAGAVDNAFKDNNDTWRYWYKSTTVTTKTLKATVDGDAVNKYHNDVKYAGCSLVFLFGGSEGTVGTLRFDELIIDVYEKPTEEKLGFYELDFTDTDGYNSANSRVELDAKVWTAPNYAPLNAAGNNRWFKFDFYDKLDSNAKCVELIDKTPCIGSTDGKIIIEKNTSYNISVNVGIATSKYVRAALALKDESGKYFFLEPTGVIEGNQTGSDTWTWSNTNTNKVLNATIDGSGSRTISGVSHNFAGCQLVILVFGQPGQDGTFYLYGANIEVCDSSVETNVLNYVKDSDGSTVYRTSGGNNIAPGASDNPLVFAATHANWMSSYIHSDGYFRFWFANPSTSYSTTDDSGKYVPNAESVHTLGKTSNIYDFFKIADPDLITDDNELGIVTIESGKKYFFTADAYLGNNGSDSSVERWLSFGLYNPIDNAVYPLPNAYIYNPGGNVGTSHMDTISVEIDSATIGANGLPYVGCQLILIGGNESRKTTCWSVGSIEMYKYDSKKNVTIDTETYNYRVDEPFTDYYTTLDINNTTLFANTNGNKPYVMTDTAHEAYGALIAQSWVFAPETSGVSVKNANEQWVPNTEFIGTNVAHVVISDPDLSTSANDQYGVLKVEYGKNYRLSLDVALSGYTPSPSGSAITNRWITIGLRNPVTKEVFFVQDATYKIFTTPSYVTYTISADIDGTLVGPDNTAYAGCEVVVAYGGQMGGGNSRVFPTQVIKYDNSEAVEQGGGVSIRPEIRDGGYNSEHFKPYTEGAAEGTYGYQTAAIRFDYLVADVIIANATKIGFVIAADTDNTMLGKSDWVNSSGVIDSGNLLGKKYDDGEDYDIYAMTITGLTKRNVTDKDLCGVDFAVCFYYTVDGVTNYVPVNYSANSYEDTYYRYKELSDAGKFDSSVYGELEWFNRNYN